MIKPPISALLVISVVTMSALVARPKAAGQAPAADTALLDRAHKLLKETPLIDGHNHLPWAMRENAGYDFDKRDIKRPQSKLHTDTRRVKQGGLGGQFWSVYVRATLQGQHAVTATLEQIDLVYTMVRRSPETFEMARTADDVE